MYIHDHTTKCFSVRVSDKASAFSRREPCCVLRVHLFGTVATLSAGDSVRLYNAKRRGGEKEKERKRSQGRPQCLRSFFSFSGSFGSISTPTFCSQGLGRVINNCTDESSSSSSSSSYVRSSSGAPLSLTQGLSQPVLVLNLVVNHW